MQVQDDQKALRDLEIIFINSFSLLVWLRALWQRLQTLHQPRPHHCKQPGGQAVGKNVKGVAGMESGRRGGGEEGG